jgi:ribosomal protein S18 acetylase RimI-like enzyme
VTVTAVAPFELRAPAEADLAAAVALHRRAIPYSLNSRLGPAHLEHAYRVMHEDPGSLVTVAARGGTVIGVVLFSLDPAALERRMVRGLGARGWLRVAAGLARDPALLVEALRQARAGGPIRGVAARLVAIAVDEDARVAGVGRALIGAVDRFGRAHGAAAYQLDTRIDNAAALAFYARCGFAEAARRGRDVVLVKELA